MSTRPLVFEGPDPERLILEAWSLHGTHVRISEPVTVRKGGLFGFFAKLHYRIEVLPGRLDVESCAVVDEAEIGSGAAPAPRVTPARSVAEKVADAKLRPAAPPLAAKGTAAVRHGPAAAPPRPAPARAPSAPTGGAAAALEALVAGTQDLVELGRDPLASFDSILEKVASSLGREPASDLGALSVDAASAAVAVGTDLLDPPAAPPAALLFDPPAPAPVARLALPERPPAPQVPAVPEPMLPPAAAMTSEEAPPTPEHLRLPVELRRDLALVGFPVDQLAEEGEVIASMQDAFAALESARQLPRTPGSLIAVVGRAAPALPVARAVAAELGLPATEIARALPRGTRVEKGSHLVVNETSEAADLSPGWRRDRVGVVLVALPPAGSMVGPEWTRAMLHALAPSMTLTTASAAAKAEDVEARCCAIGGADALVLEDLDSTLTPASVLAVGIPVVTLDGRPATPAAWAEIAERALQRRRSGR